jgi:hypothetical protein
MKLVFAVFSLLLLLFLSFWIWKREKSSLRIFFWPALLLKLSAGICLGLVYTYYYTVGDTFSYFEDGVKLAALGRTDLGSYISFLWSGDESFLIWPELLFQQPRAMFLSKIASVFCLLTHDNYWIISLYFSAITFICAWWLVKKIAVMHPSAKKPAVIGFLFFPSAVFWSSGLIKESIAMASLFFLSTLFLKAWRKEILQVSEWLSLVLALWFLWNLKYYYLAIFLPVAFTALSVKFLLPRLRIQSLSLKIGLGCLLFFIPILLVSILHPNFYPHRFMGVVVSSYYEFEGISNPEDLIHYTALKATPLSLMKNMPWALLSGLFRPFATEAHGSLQFFASIENLMLLVLFFFALTGVKKLKNSKYSLVLFSIILYSILLCIFLALSTPNFGTLSRYRVGFLPFLVFLLTLENPLISKLETSWSKIIGRLVR